MGAQYTTAQAKAAKKYLEGFEEIKLRIPNGKKDEYKRQAEAAGKSLNQYIIECIENGRK